MYECLWNTWLLCWEPPRNAPEEINSFGYNEKIET